jgi:hypothetical protein
VPAPVAWQPVRSSTAASAENATKGFRIGRSMTGLQPPATQRTSQA